MALVSGRKPAGKAAAAGDSSNDDPEFVDAKNEDDIYMVPLGMGKGNYGRAPHDYFLITTNLFIIFY